ncbi:MAG: hypothetical protein JSU70_12085 [Phycisphaerales bacterium]|nr:MAG: hypothetical protein JSU70_12085 [Phycisphaerales bacterium]
MKKKISTTSRKAGALVLVLALGLASVSLAEEGIWTTKTDMPTGRWALCTSVVDGTIYAIGGASSYSSKPLRTVEEYDPATDSWTTRSGMPTARMGFSTSVVNGKIYAMGGGDMSGGASAIKAFSTVEEYDPATDTWTTKSEMPTARFAHSANVLDGRIYVIGGGPSCPWCGAILTLEVYEPATDTWTWKADIPRAIISASTSVVDGKIYAIGGEGTARRVDEYDPVADTWTRKADMPTPTTDLSTSVAGGKIYAIGGDGTGTGIVATVEVYDPGTDTWTTAPDMPTARTGVSTSMVNGKIYAIGGLASWGGTGLRTVEEYDLTPPPPDYSGNGLVDFADMCILAKHWHANDPLCDIGPWPFGDGIVDFRDLAVLSEYWLADLRLLAHWKLDETEGAVALDSIGGKDGYGTPDLLWRPEGGKVGGALELDGVDDFLFTTFTLNPADASFSVFAWVKGGAAGQVIVSQATGADWLCADPSGNLMTSLSAPAGSRFLPKPLVSESAITDGEWRRVGFTWDGSARVLYVDDIEVATDMPLLGLAESDGNLYIGVGSNLEAGSHWFGLIDDVRIYDRAIQP